MKIPILSQLKDLFIGSGDNEIARVDNVGWHGRERGEMVLSRGEIRIYEKPKFLQIKRSPDMVLRVPTFLVTSFELDSEGTLIIERVDQDENTIIDLVTFASEDDARLINDAMQIVMDGLGIESKQAQKERVARQAKEREEWERQEEILVVQNETQLAWMTAGQIWEIVVALGQIVRALPGEDWDSIEAAWRKLTVIEGKSILNLSVALNSFLPIMDSKTADEMYKGTLAFVKTMEEAIESLKSSRAGEENLVAKYDDFPRWSHMPYFLLFTLIYSETMLCYESGDNQTASENIARLNRIATVLQHTFKLELESHISIFGAALEIGDPYQVHKTGHDIETYILEFLEKKAEI